jgi:DNA-binding Lrp family transcriptional regulator
MRNLIGLKPQDVLLMMKLLSEPNLSQMGLARKLQLSQAEVSHGLKRLKGSHLLNIEGKVIKEAALELLVHAVKYFYPAQIGAPSLGVPTAHANPAFKYVKNNEGESYVWPFAEGKVKGISLIPIYPSFPYACSEDKVLYKMASLVEMIRAGRARERKIAEDELHKLIKGLNEK